MYVFNASSQIVDVSDIRIVYKLKNNSNSQ